jgi:hypothetical protein
VHCGYYRKIFKLYSLVNINIDIRVYLMKKSYKFYSILNTEREMKNILMFKDNEYYGRPMPKFET